MDLLVSLDSIFCARVCDSHTFISPLTEKGYRGSNPEERGSRIGSFLWLPFLTFEDARGEEEDDAIC